MTSLADDDDDDDGELTVLEEGGVGQASVSHVARPGLRASILTGHLHAGRSKHSKDETTLRARGTPLSPRGTNILSRAGRFLLSPEADDRFRANTEGFR